MRNSRFTLAINGIVMMFLGLAFWFRPEFFTLAMFPEVKENLQENNFKLIFMLTTVQYKLVTKYILALFVKK